jgi:LCP family protein required for cell wall assembly
VVRARGASTIAGKAGYILSCGLAVVVLVVSGFAYYVRAQVDAIGGSNAIAGGGPSAGAMNILLMGLESRTDYHGNILPDPLLAALHSGSRQQVENGTGGQDTNTLILIHIFAGGQRAAGFSIPRDDWVTFPKAYDGQSQGKIDQAYGLAYAQSLSQTANSSMSRDQRYLLANEAGQAAAIATVEAVTGQHVDHFAEVNLAGFYGLARATGGIEVCVKSWHHGQNLHDYNSGFNQPHAGYLHLSAGQTLAFVRERDNLPNGDLDRTHRQQAVIDYVVWKLAHQGVFTSIGQLTHLLGIAKSYIITDSGWHILDFATEMHALTGRNLTFQTLPIEGYHTYYLGGTAEDANVINVPAIKELVKKAFTAPASSSHSRKSRPKPAAAYPLSATTVDVYNAGYTAGLAAQVSAGLVNAGFRQGRVGDASVTQSTTEVRYGAGAAARANAVKIAALFGVTAQSGSSVTAGHVEVILGSSATLPSFGSLPGSSTASSPSPGSSSSTGAATSSNGAAGAPVVVKPNAPYGIPCVY